MFSFDSDSRETRTTLMKSFRLERGGSFESGFQNGLVKLHQKHRVAKNYAVSDELRELLQSAGVKIKQGTAGYEYGDIPDALKNMTVDDRWSICND